LDEKYKPGGYVIGMNSGLSAAQTISHARIHVIPPHQGDAANPSAGVGGVIPEKQDY
jgi:diadenosine tetraphosphate (Ap4A) HIT family hydrolase